MVQIRQCLLLLITYTATWPVAAEELWERQWFEIQSQNFQIVSGISRKKTEKLAREMENFRAAVLTVTQTKRAKDPIPTVFFVLPYLHDEFGVEGAGAMSKTRNHQMPGMRASSALAFVAPDPSFDAATQLKHEYTHILLRGGDTDYPLWIGEGLAYMFQTLKVDANKLTYGKPPRSRVEWLEFESWIPYKTVLEARSEAELNGVLRAKVYSQSWLLMHFLMLGRSGRKFEFDCRRYLGLSESGSSASEAFGQGFGLQVSQLQGALQSYAKSGLGFYRMPLAHNLSETTASARPMSGEVVAAQLGTLLIGFGHPEEARHYFDAALALNPEYAQALVGIGEVLRMADRFDEATPYYERAIALAPQNAWIELDYGEHFLAQAQKTVGAMRRAELLANARIHFARSYALDPNDPETLAMNGSSYLFAGESNAKALESLRAAHQMLPANRKIELLLAQAYVAAGDTDRAIELLRSLVAWADEPIATPAREMLVRLAVPAPPAPVLP